MKKHRDAHGYRFHKYGKAAHLVIESVDDLRLVTELDPAHWVASSAPVADINADRDFLQHVDHDANQRITHSGISSAVAWVFRVFKTHDGFFESSQILKFDCINSADEEGKRIISSARKVIDRLSAEDTDSIGIGQIRKIKREIESQPVSEAGVVLPSATESETAAAFLRNAILVTGGCDHPSGGKGMSRKLADDFVRLVSDYISWRDSAINGKVGGAEISAFSLGTETGTLYERHKALLEKIDQFFALSAAAGIDERVISNAYFNDAALMELGAADPERLKETVLAAPMASPDPSMILRLDACSNAYFKESLHDFFHDVVDPLLGDGGKRGERGKRDDDDGGGRGEGGGPADGGPAGGARTHVDRIDFEQWKNIRSSFESFAMWQASRPPGSDVMVEIDDIERYLDTTIHEEVISIIERSVETAFVLENIRLLEKAILYQMFMVDLVNNFVSFPYLYDSSRRAVFEKGSLLMDGKYFNLAVSVENRARHRALAVNANMFVLYIQVYSKSGIPEYEVAVPVTAGGKGNLFVGKRGVFIDLNGAEHDAEITDIIENPISVSQAIVAPFKRLGRLLTGKIEAITADAQKQLDTVATQGLSSVAAPEQQAQIGVQSPQKGFNVANVLLGGGIAIAAVGSAVAYITNTVTQLRWWQILGGLIGAVLAVALPATFLAFLKIRKRDLSAIIEASGWAVNACMRMTRRLNRAFTRRPAYPDGAKGVPVTKRRRAVLFVLIALPLAAALIVVLTILV